MANLETIQAALDRIEREIKVRDEGLRRAFEILVSAIERNDQTLEMIHEQTVAVPATVDEHLDLLDERIHNAVVDAMDDYFNPLGTVEASSPCRQAGATRNVPMITPRSGAAGSRKSAAAMAEYQSATKDVPELAASLTAYLGERYGPELAGGTAAIPARNMHPLVADLLEIDTSRSQTLEEMTNLLAGLTTSRQGHSWKGDPALDPREGSPGVYRFHLLAPKSFHIALALAPTDAERQTLETCWLRANAAVCDLIESHVGRRGWVPAVAMAQCLATWR